jgi:hypothetical protein
MDVSWTAPVLFSYLSLKDFYFLYIALLLEKTIVFVGGNKAAVSSCCLAM